MNLARVRRHRTATVAAVTLALVLSALAAAEFTARALLHDRLSAAAERMLGEGGEIEVEGGPALLDLFDRRLDAVTVTGEHATLGRLPDVAVRARVTGLRLTGGRSGTVDRTHAEVEIPAASLRAAAPEGLPVTEVRLDEPAGTVTLGLQGGLGRAVLRPALQDGRLALELESVSVLGRPAPEALTGRIERALAERAPRDYPLGLTATTVEVTEAGLALTLDGGRARLGPAHGRT
ncbi:LmeA family phospholipid-binding protein [Streptomyces sp. NPDC048002]|uniref:LmeA family phospholipid-binding protein n=1 Tax=Streptomyces sp. NPDC048002 TaxID=3154344 RepID=UPI0033F437D1